MPFGKHLLINLSLLALLIASLVFCKKQDFIKLLSNGLVISFVLFFGWYAISLLWSSNLTSGLGQLKVKLGLLIIPFVVVSSANFLSATKQKKVLQYFVWGNVAVLAACFLSSIIKAVKLGSFIRVSPGGTYTQNLFSYEALSEDFMHPGYLCTYVGIAIIVLVVQAIKHIAWRKWYYYLSLAVLFMGMILLQGRINVLALLIVLGCSALFYAIKQKAFKMAALGIIPFLLMFLFVVFAPKHLKERYLQLPNFNYDISGTDFNSATYRLAEWSSAEYVIQEHPIVGTGLGDNRTALIDVYKKRGFSKGVERKFNAHNQYLETTIATGFIGLLILLSIFIVQVNKAVKMKNHTLLLSVLFFALCIITESMLERAWAITLFSSLFPLLASSKQGSTY